MTRLGLFLLALACAAFPSPALADTRDLAVMLTIQRDDGSVSDLCGAGIVISQTQTRTLILTANHLVEDLKQATREEHTKLTLRAEFRSRRGQYFVGTVLSGSGLSDPEIDYALVAIAGPSTPRIDPADFATIGAVDDGHGGRKSVRAIGNSECTAWDMDGEPRPIISANGFSIVYENVVVGGASGGPLFTFDGSLVGMVIKSDGRRGLARPIGPLLTALEGQGVELSLHRKRSDETVAIDADSDLAPAATIASSLSQRDVNVRVEAVGKSDARYVITLPEPAAQHFEAAIWDREIQKSPNGIRFIMTDAEAKQRPPRITLVFNDKSRLGPLMLDPATALKETIARGIRRRGDKWRPTFICPNCVDLSPAGGEIVDNGPDVDINERIEGIAAGLSPDRLDYLFDCRSCSPRYADDIVAGRTNPIPVKNLPGPSLNPIYYSVVLSDGTLTEIRKKDPVPKRCDPHCPMLQAALLASDRKAPPVLIEQAGSSPSFRLRHAETFKEDHWTIEVDAGSGSVIDNGGALAALPANRKIKIRYSRPKGEVLGAYEYRLPSILPALKSGPALAVP